MGKLFEPSSRYLKVPERRKAISPSKGVATMSNKYTPKADNIAADADKDGINRQREAVSPHLKPLSPHWKRSPVGRRGSPRWEPSSLLRQHAESSLPHRADFPSR
ncbi:unnamed protein product [Fraxinus pennsylvanica]|uniref:Uncharacterized protein n=1 Tax=Fraxinus pennsylvanica TaxID=56036 RepID=A0AAD1YSI4_9LAMI|nr:unnamed protein product [Fraxinus pennsylvanica]